MARPKSLIPTYQLHKKTGQARTYIDGRDYYLGKYGSDESRRRYGELLARVASGLPPIDPMTKPAPIAADDPGPSVNEVCLVFWRHAEKHYVKNKKPTSELYCFKSCLKILRELYGLTPAKDFGPLALKAVRATMIKQKWVRSSINRMIGRVRQVFKHAIENEMIDADVLARLQAVAPLLADKTVAHDNAPRTSVDRPKIDAVRSIVRPMIRDLIDLQLLTGARPGELLKVTPRMVDRSSDVWKAEITDHKTAHHQKTRILYFGPQAQAILKKYLRVEKDESLFGIRRTSYCRAITRACEKAKISRWTPHWLRHTFCTAVREQYGIEAAQALAGHSTRDMTEQYSSQMNSLANKTAAVVG